MGLCVHEIILTGNGFYNSPHRKLNVRAQNFMSHTRLAAESHKHRCWRVSALLINTASLQTCSDLTPDVHSNASRDLSVKSLGSQITSRLFSLVIEVCLMLIQSRVSSLIWMLLDKNAEHVRCVLTSIPCSCEAPSLGSGVFFSHNVVTYLLKPSQYHIPGSSLVKQGMVSLEKV